MVRNDLLHGCRRCGVMFCGKYSSLGIYFSLRFRYLTKLLVEGICLVLLLLSFGCFSLLNDAKGFFYHKAVRVCEIRRGNREKIICVALAVFHF